MAKIIKAAFGKTMNMERNKATPDKISKAPATSNEYCIIKKMALIMR